MRQLKAKECTSLASEVTCRMSSFISFHLSLIIHPILFPRSEVPCMELAELQGQSLITRGIQQSEERGRKWVRFGYFPWFSPFLVHIRWLHSLQPTTHSPSGWLSLYFLFEESWNCICLPQTSGTEFCWYQDLSSTLLSCEKCLPKYNTLIFEGIGSHDFTCQDSWL